MKKSSGISPFVRIEAKKGWAHLNLRELWTYRELLYFFIWRDVKVRYKQTALGILWALLQPLFSMLVFTIFFGRLAKVSSDGIPYTIFSYVALVPWMFFSNGLTLSSSCLVVSSNMLKKVYFPRLTLPVATVIAGLVDLAVALLLLGALLALHHRQPSPRIVWLPAFLLLALAASLGCGLWLSAINVKYRDIRYVVPFLVQLWLFATPVVYSSSLLHEPWHSLFGLNPMAGVVEGFRWAVLGTNISIGKMAAVSAVTSLCLALSGLLYFRSVERTFADVV
ncbi:MAG: ABC transporter permease [Acidobacteriaceae bacterium]|nr:ABC transporter permease [Acidobacteriaceae bacterium]